MPPLTNLPSSETLCHPPAQFRSNIRKPRALPQKKVPLGNGYIIRYQPGPAERTEYEPILRTTF